MRKGFLPIKNNWFDRLFIAVITFIGIQFIWMRFVEEIAAIEVSMILGFIPVSYTHLTLPTSR